MFFPFHIPMLVLVVVLLVVLFSPHRRSGKIWMVSGLVIALGVMLILQIRIRRNFDGWPRIGQIQSSQQGPLPRPMAVSGRPRPTTTPATQTSQLWIDDWTAFVNSTGFRGFRVESSDTSPTQQISLDEATRQAVNDLQRMLLSDPRVSAAMGKLRISGPTLTRRIESEVRSGSVVVEQHVYTTQKSYGTLWKTYLLVDTSPATMDRLSREVTGELHAHNRRQLAAAASVGATILVVLLLYAFLNTVTKGYFVWRLRAAVILVLIAGVLIFFANI